MDLAEEAQATDSIILSSSLSLSFLFHMRQRFQLASGDRKSYCLAPAKWRGALWGLSDVTRLHGEDDTCKLRSSSRGRPSGQWYSQSASVTNTTNHTPSSGRWAHECHS